MIVVTQGLTPNVKRRADLFVDLCKIATDPEHLSSLIITFFLSG